VNDILVNLYVVDSRPTYLTELMQTLSPSLRCRVVQYGGGEQLVSALPDMEFSPYQMHIALVAYQFMAQTHMTLNGLEVLESIRRASPHVMVVMLANGNEVEYSALAVAEGALAVVPRSSTMVIQITSVILRYTSTARVAIRRLQLLKLLIALCVGVVLFCIALVVCQ
jgi:hypothetical protein